MTSVTQEPRERPYLGRHVSLPPHPVIGGTVAQRIAFLKEAVRTARYNAYRVRKIGDLDASAFAFCRAHEYCEMIRKLKAKL